MAQPTPHRRPPHRAWHRQLWVQVLIAMAAGVALGWFFPSAGTAMQPFGDGFIKAIRALIAPLIFCTVVHGIAHMTDAARVGRVALKALVYFEVLTSAALLIGLLAVNLLQPGAGMNIDVTHLDSAAAQPYIHQAAAATGVIAFLLNVIPNTFIGAFVDGNILQVLIIAVLSGFALVSLGTSGRPLVQWLDALAKMMFAAVGILMWLAPLGAFGAIAFTVGKFGVGSLASLGKLIGEFYAVCLIYIVVALGAVAQLAGFSLFRLMRYLWDDILMCIATTSSEIVMPRLINKMTAAGCDASVVGLVVPSGYSFNLDGTCLYLATATVFLAQATHTPLPLTQQLGLLLILLLTSKGAAGVSGAAFVVLAATLSASQSIPVASVALILGIHRLLAQALVPTNYIGNAVATIVVAKWEHALDLRRLQAVLNRRRVARAAPSDAAED